MKIHTLILPAAIAAAVAAGCTPTIRTENEITVKPIHMTLDVNLKVDQELNRALSADSANIKADPDSNDPRERRRARRDQLRTLKSAHLVGENNRGYLEIRTADGTVSDSVRRVIDQENADRALVFEEIARSQNITSEAVGQRWATRMADRAPAGTYYQNSSGSWVEKYD